jgi:la-related protein 1
MKAINEISKSGEVWCEGARLCMTNNSSNSFYSLKNSLQYLKFAILFTPQYGDSFIELIRICLTIKKSLKERTLSIGEE